jgi:hypothetical protein
MKNKFVITAYGKKCLHDIELTLPMSKIYADIALDTLKNIIDKDFTDMFENFRITEIECTRCHYYSGHGTCWAIKDMCNISHPKCDYRFDTTYYK